MSKKLYEEEDIRAIAGAIRKLNGTSTTYKASEMASAITAAGAASVVTLDGTAAAAQVLSGYTFYNKSSQTKVTGTMANKGAWSATGTSNVTIPAGYHNGSGTAKLGDAYTAGQNNIRNNAGSYSPTGGTADLLTFHPYGYFTGNGWSNDGSTWSKPYQTSGTPLTWVNTTGKTVNVTASVKYTGGNGGGLNKPRIVSSAGTVTGAGGDTATITNHSIPNGGYVRFTGIYNNGGENIGYMGLQITNFTITF